MGGLESFALDRNRYRAVPRFVCDDPGVPVFANVLDRRLHPPRCERYRCSSLPSINLWIRPTSSCTLHVQVLRIWMGVHSSSRFSDLDFLADGEFH